MNIKKKGKVHPFPPSSKGDDCLSVLKLLPAVILLLVSSLSPEDKQVLAYLITRSVKTTTTTTAVSSGRRSSYTSKNNNTSKNKKATTHKAPRFDCECFDCYTSYWFRWDTSPNRELIHQIIEAYEDHLSKSENSNNGRGGRKKKEKSRRRRAVEHSGRPEEPVEPMVASVEVKPEESPEMSRCPVATRQHKGLARKVLPDVMGLFNWRFWRLWNPNA